MYVKEKTNKTENETMHGNFLTGSEGILVNVVSCNLETQTKGSALGTWLEVLENSKILFIIFSVNFAYSLRIHKQRRSGDLLCV